MLETNKHTHTHTHSYLRLMGTSLHRTRSHLLPTRMMGVLAWACVCRIWMRNSAARSKEARSVMEYTNRNASTEETRDLASPCITQTHRNTLLLLFKVEFQHVCVCKDPSLCVTYVSHFYAIVIHFEQVTHAIIFQCASKWGYLVDGCLPENCTSPPVSL